MTDRLLDWLDIFAEWVVLRLLAYMEWYRDRQRGEMWMWAMSNRDLIRAEMEKPYRERDPWLVQLNYMVETSAEAEARRDRERERRYAEQDRKKRERMRALGRPGW